MDGDFSYWWGVVVVAAVTPVILIIIRWVGHRHSERKTKEMIDASNAEGAVPDVPEDFEVPQVVPRRPSRAPRPRQFR
jgi:hypothetical protein